MFARKIELKKILIFIFIFVFVFTLFGCYQDKTLDNEVFEVIGIKPDGAKKQDNVYYYVVKDYDDYVKLIKDKIEMNNPERFDEEFFEKKMIIFLRVQYSIGVDDLQVFTAIENNDLVIDLQPTFNFGQYFDGRRIGIIIDKVGFNKIKIK